MFKLHYSIHFEGLDEFDSDEENMKAWMECFDKPKPQFCKKVGKTLLIGLSTTRFRDAPYSSHEVHVDDEQLAWFLNIVKEHSHEEGWKVGITKTILNHCIKYTVANVRRYINQAQPTIWFFIFFCCIPK